MLGGYEAIRLGGLEAGKLEGYKTVEDRKLRAEEYERCARRAFHLRSAAL